MQIKMIKILSIISINLVFQINFIQSIKKIECGYKQCPQTRDGALNVHIIPHSHMDAGWVKTFDEYYYGTRTTVSTANVQLIYHSVLSELMHDKRRKFTFSETAYFWRWWKEQRPSMRAIFRSLVQEGRLEFAGGGWVQNDEATANYLQIIDQFTWGLRKLNDTLGPCGKPKAAWQIDTYGHTREQVSLLAQMGFDGLFIGRVDHKQREIMIDEDRMEFMWRGSDTLGKMSDIMSHTLFNLYNAPEGFCFDFLCSDEPVVDDTDNHAHNADKRITDFISQIEKQAKYYDHDNIVVTMGGDFTYQGAANWFMNVDKIINYVNSHPGNLSDINIFYSTPSCYLKAIYLYGRRDKAIYTEKGDHLPYGSDSMTYWTGFYSSRPALKYLARRVHVFLQVMKQLTVVAKLGDSYELHLLRHAVSLVLHHDAITGTSQQHVSNDYVRILTEALDASTKKVSSLLSYLTPTWGGSRRSKNNQQFVICHQLNMSQCRFTETQESILVLVYNPLSTKTYHHVRFPAVASHYSIRDANDEEVDYQLVPLPAAVINLPGRSSSAIQELCFEAENIPPLGFNSFYISPVRETDDKEFAKRESKEKRETDQESTHYISNEYLKVSVDKSTGLLNSVQLLDGTKVGIYQNFYFYPQGQQGLQSGAYSFRPERQRPVAVTDKVTFHTIRGTLVKEIRQRFNDWITQIIRLYRGEEFLELEYIIGPVPVGTDLGKEVVSMFTTNISNGGQFFTDANGRQMIKRTCWNETNLSQPQKKSISACYYPVTSRICVHSLNSSVEMCVLPDRTQGASSYNDGEVELMVHRRLLTDDGFGLEEALNEEAFGVGLVVRGKHRILFANKQDQDEQFSERVSHAARRWINEPWLFFSSGEKLSRRKWQNARNKRFSALKTHGLPRYIHILTLEPWKEGTVLLRLENTMENPIREKSDTPEDLISSSHVVVDLQQMFLFLHILRVRETTLAANQWLDDARQMDWSTRYVYSGADDGLLPEDVEETEDRHVVSDEEQEDRKRYNTYKRTDNTKKTHNYEKRKKRQVNMVKDDLENTINYTNNFDIRLEEPITISTAISEVSNNMTRKVEATQKTPKLSFLSRMKPSKIVMADWTDVTEEVSSTEEDFSGNLKKRPAKRKSGKAKKKKNEEPIFYDSDDGITKSIYDMYYKNYQFSERTYPLTRNKHTNRHTLDYEDVTAKRSKKKKIEEKIVYGEMLKGERAYGETEGAREKGREARTRYRRMDMTEYEDEDDDDDDEEDEEEENTRTAKLRRVLKTSHRKKRTVSKDEEDNSEPAEDSEYMITLRPTQIRTFVIWFERKPYNKRK